MSTTAIIIAIVIIAAIVLMIAWALYWSGFRLKDLTFKLFGLVDAKLERKPGDDTATTTEATSVDGIEQKQQAEGQGSLIENSPQHATTPGVKQTMQATQGGKISGSGQTATGPASQQQNAGDGGVIKNSSQKVE
ncbi:MAG: hypothetical protein HYR94_18935 [Chloroflexi bacterium]|nr:hypothetical protein [Chloroflexota bacterium]